MRFALALLAALASACASAPADLGLPDGSPLRLGVSVAEARAALHADAEPVRGGALSELILKLDARGIEVFFDREDRVRTVRLYPPYAVPVRGVRLGDSSAQVLAHLGKPAAKTIAGDITGYTYHPDEITILTYMVGEGDRVTEIFLVR